MHPRLKDLLRPYVLVARKIRRERPNLATLAWSRAPSFSQRGEDLYLLEYFHTKREGFFVDVGAYHPFSHSNTYSLYRRGWHGINLEPAPDALAQLQRHRPRDINLPYAAASEEGTVTFALAGAFAGIADDQHLWGDMPADRRQVEARRLSRILDDHLPRGFTIDLLDVDCEGHDLDVLQSNDWQRYRPTLVMAEAHDQQSAQDLDAFMASVGYRRRTTLDFSLIYEIGTPDAPTPTT